MSVFARWNENLSKDNCIENIDLERDLTNKETAAVIKSLADGLSEKQRMIFLLRDLQDLTIQEVADITGMSESGIKANLFYARQNIKKKLARLEVRI
jgi:RNA polymerase sigma-70 factor (ECF subfamily)